MAFFSVLAFAYLAYAAPAYAEENATNGATASTDPYLGNPDKSCKDIKNATDDPVCYSNVTWAMKVGIFQHPEYYKNFTNLTSASSRVEFQCALAMMVGGDQEGMGHSCPVPCETSLPACAIGIDSGDDSGAAPNGGGSGSGSLPMWAWALIALAVVALIGALAWVMMGKKKGAKKTKRVAKFVEAPTHTSARAAPEPTSLVAPPIYVTSARAALPTITAPPVYVTATPVYAAAEPVYAAAAPPVYTAAPAQSSSFVVPSNSSFVAMSA